MAAAAVPRLPLPNRQPCLACSLACTSAVGFVGFVCASTTGGFVCTRTGGFVCTLTASPKSAPADRRCLWKAMTGPAPSPPPAPAPELAPDNGGLKFPNEALAATLLVPVFATLQVASLYPCATLANASDFLSRQHGLVTVGKDPHVPSTFLEALGLATAAQRDVAGHGWALHTPGLTRSCSAPCQPPRCWCEAGPTRPLARTQPPGEIRAAVAQGTHAQPLHSLGHRLL